VKESAPVFAAVFAWHPALLVGLLAVKWWGASEPDQAWLRRPFHSARTSRDLLDWRRAALPWGLVAAFPLWGSARVFLALLLGYSQLLLAQDDARLYQWAAPAVLALIPSLPHELVVSACVVQPFILGAYRGT